MKGNDVALGDDRPNPADFITYFPWACVQLEIEEPIIINKVMYYDTATHSDSKSMRKPSRSARSRQSKILSTEDKEDEYQIEVIPMQHPKNVVKIWAFFDKTDNLIQISFDKSSKIPQKVLKVLTLLVPFHPTLQNITIRGRIDMYTIPEITNLILSNNITELSFDGVFLKEANYYLLFDHETLQSISLARCGINDYIIEIIASKLVYPLPASKFLSFLNLASNFISDTGAAFLGEALRSNRRLYYLNLSGNRLTDNGASHILDSLLEFPMKIDESVAMKTRYVDYLKRRNEFLKTALDDIKRIEEEKTKAPKVKDKKGKVQKPEDVSIDNPDERALTVAQNLFGVHDDPFLTDTVVKNGLLWSKGNNTLCYLNLGYNDLSYFTIKKLLRVTRHQKFLDRKPKGLVKVVLHGNPMPFSCQELTDVDDIFLMEIISANKRASSFIGKKKIRSSHLKTEN